MGVKNAIVIVALLIVIYYLSNHYYIGKEAITASDGEKYYVVGGYQNQQGAAEMLANVNKNVMLFLKYLKIKYRVNYTDISSAEYNTAEISRIKEEFKNMPNRAVPRTITMGMFPQTNYVKDFITNSIKSLLKPESFTGRHTSHYTRPEPMISGLVSSVIESGHNDFSNKAVTRVLTGYDLENIIENDPTASGDNTYTVDKGAKMVVCLRSRETFLLHDLHTVMFVVLHELAHIANEKWGHSSESQFWEIFKFLLHEAKECGMHEPVDYELRPIRYCGLDVNYNPYFDESVRELW